jgi:hypothetical protein
MAGWLAVTAGLTRTADGVAAPGENFRVAPARDSCTAASHVDGLKKRVARCRRLGSTEASAVMH